MNSVELKIADILLERIGRQSAGESSQHVANYKEFLSAVLLRQEAEEMFFRLSPNRQAALRPKENE